jgi:hypothetical protein
MPRSVEETLGKHKVEFFEADLPQGLLAALLYEARRLQLQS